MPLLDASDDHDAPNEAATVVASRSNRSEPMRPIARLPVGNWHIANVASWLMHCELRSGSAAQRI
jgi:hypothetical protein